MELLSKCKSLTRKENKMQQNELISLAINGDNSAIEQLYNEYKKPVYFLALKLMGNGKDAADVLQYTFFQAFHRLKSLKKPEKFEDWLYVIASNRCTMLLREKDPIKFNVDGSEAPKVKFGVSNTPVRTAAADDEKSRNAVAQIIDRIPDLTRISVMMYYYALCDITQIRKVVRIDEDFIKKYLDEGTERINNELESLKGQRKALEDYKGIGELYNILHRCAEDCVIAKELDETILHTVETIVLASLNSLPEISYVQVQEEDNTPSAAETTAPAVKKSDDTAQPANNRKKTAIRNLILIAVILILAAGIIITSVSMLRQLAKNSSGSNPDDVNDRRQSETVERAPSETTDEVTAEPYTEPTDTESPVTESETSEPVETAPVETLPPETEPVETETEPVVNGDSLTSAEASKLYVCKTNADGVTISSYKGTAKEVDIPGMIDGKPVTVIGANAFNGNTSIVSVNIPDSVTRIEGGAFTGCTALTSVHFPANLTEIGSYAFMKCSSLANIKIPATVNNVGLTAFGDTAWMRAQNNSFVIVGDGVLVRYTGTDADVVVPDTVKYITNAFYYNTSVKTITVQEGVKKIGQYAFCACTKLNKIVLPSSVTEIASDAIYQCASLTAVTAPAGSYAAGKLSK